MFHVFHVFHFFRVLHVLRVFRDRSDKSHMATWELGVKAPADESQCCEMLVVRSHRASLVGSTREQQWNQWEREMMKDGKKLGGGEKRMRATWGDHPYYLMFQCPARHVVRDMRNTFLGCNDSFSTVCGCYDTCLCEFCGKTAALSAMLRTPTSMSVMFFADLRAPDLRFGAMRMNTLVWHDMNRCLFTRWAWKHQRGTLKCASMQYLKSMYGCGQTVPQVKVWLRCLDTILRGFTCGSQGGDFDVNVAACPPYELQSRMNPYEPPEDEIRQEILEFATR